MWIYPAFGLLLSTPRVGFCRQKCFVHRCNADDSVAALVTVQSVPEDWVEATHKSLYSCGSARANILILTVLT
jgi:hypothetical protein